MVVGGRSSDSHHYANRVNFTSIKIIFCIYFIQLFWHVCGFFDFRLPTSNPMCRLKQELWRKTLCVCYTVNHMTTTDCNDIPVDQSDRKRPALVDGYPNCMQTNPPSSKISLQLAKASDQLVNPVVRHGTETFQCLILNMR